MQLLATFISQELARLRQFHKKYLKFIKSTLTYAYSTLGKKYLYGLRIIIKGQLTNYRRRMKRSQLITIKIGRYLRSHQTPAVIFASERSFNRYGILGVSVSAQLRTARRYDEGYITYSNEYLIKSFSSGFLKSPNVYFSK